MLKQKFILAIILFNLTSISAYIKVYAAPEDKKPHQLTVSEKKYIRQTDHVKKILSDTRFVTNHTIIKALLDAEVLQYRDPVLLNAVKMYLNSYRKYNSSVVLQSLEAAITLYPTGLEEPVQNIANNTSDAMTFASAIHYLIRSRPSRVDEMQKLVKSRFKESKQPVIRLLEEELKPKKEQWIHQRPSLVSLLSHPYPEAVIFSFHRKNRNYPGVAVVKLSDGKFLRTEDGSIFNVPQIARSVSGLPPYIFNGNTPQGIFFFDKFAKSSNPYIGPTPVIATGMPFEVSVEKFFNVKEKQIRREAWSLEKYLSLLPEEYKKYPPLQESFFAGQVGRSEIYVHGTLLDPSHYRGASYYPFTPTQGCLSSFELWSDTGELLESEHLSLMLALEKANVKKGYLIVMDMDQQNSPVTVSDIIMDILQAEGKLSKE